MKFKTEHQGNLIVWGNGKAVCKFVNGECEVNDKQTIDFLMKNGYESDGEILDVTDEKPQFIESNINELRQEAKEKGIKGYHKMKPETLKERLEEGE